MGNSKSVILGASSPIKEPKFPNCLSNGSAVTLSGSKVANQKVSDSARVILFQLRGEKARDFFFLETFSLAISKRNICILRKHVFTVSGGILLTSGDLLTSVLVSW